MTTHQIELPSKLVPVFSAQNKRFRCAWGGRGSAKTRSFAKMAAAIGLIAASNGISGIVLCCRELMNSLDDSSMAEVKAAIESDEWLKSNYEVGEKYIRTGGHLPGRVDFKFAGLRHNLDSIKSKARILLCWVDEADPVTETAWSKLIPTVREDGSEIWVTWNPENPRSATDDRFCKNIQDDDIISVEMNWRDNPWFPPTLEAERRRDERDRPDQYDHVWEGGYKTVYEGAYYAKSLIEAKKQGRITELHIDPSLTVRTWHDLAGAGDKADAYSMWVGQFVGQQVWLQGHYCTEGQPSAFHINWLRKWCVDRGVRRCVVTLPHDGDAVKIDHAWRDIWEAASGDEVEFVVEVIPNQGRGAAMKRVEAGRKLFPRVWFNEKATVAGRESLTAYHEKRDENRSVGLGPNHNWASHDADSFGLMACVYEPPGGGVNIDAIKAAMGGAVSGSFAGA